jgi:hypothetical protein
MADAHGLPLSSGRTQALLHHHTRAQVGLTVLQRKPKPRGPFAIARQKAR